MTYKKAPPKMNILELNQDLSAQLSSHNALKLPETLRKEDVLKEDNILGNPLIKYSSENELIHIGQALYDVKRLLTFKKPEGGIKIAIFSGLMYLCYLLPLALLFVYLLSYGVQFDFKTVLMFGVFIFLFDMFVTYMKAAKKFYRRYKNIPDTKPPHYDTISNNKILDVLHTYVGRNIYESFYFITSGGNRKKKASFKKIFRIFIITSTLMCLLKTYLDKFSYHISQFKFYHTLAQGLTNAHKSVKTIEYTHALETNEFWIIIAFSVGAVLIWNRLIYTPYRYYSYKKDTQI